MNRLRVRRLRQDSRGFTIIELLIATAVFSVILLGVTLAIMQISRTYYKGVITTNTQNTTRQIMDTLSQAVQFSGDTIVPTPDEATAQPVGTNLAFCIGNKKFSYVLGRALYDSGPYDGTNKRMPHVLVEQSSAADCGGTPIPYDLGTEGALPPGMRELMNSNMRLTDLRVFSIGDNMYRITVRVAHGDADLFDNADSASARCKGDAGSRFCAVSELSTVVTKRIGSTP